MILKNTSSSNGDIHDGYISKDGKLVVDFLQAIHAAEERQAELDAHSFMTEIRAIKVQRQLFFFSLLSTGAKHLDGSIID